LARRLLTQKSFSIEIEKHAISQFKQVGSTATLAIEWYSMCGQSHVALLVDTPCALLRARCPVPPQACGPQFTFVLESCLTDFAASKDVTEVRVGFECLPPPLPPLTVFPRLSTLTLLPLTLHVSNPAAGFQAVGHPYGRGGVGGVRPEAGIVATLQ
jgi:hypothetical protein